MDMRQFCARLHKDLYPTVYRGRALTDADAAPFALLLKQMKWVTLGRYALAVLPWEAVKVKSQLLQVARSSIRKHMFTIPCFWQVGLYLVVVGPNEEWEPSAGEISADQTGLHSVIIQAVHFIDLESGVTALNRSQWGTIQFGGTASATGVVYSILRPRRHDRNEHSESIRAQHRRGDGDATGGLVPYKNPNALASYYCGVFGLISCIVLLGFFGILPIVLGILGLKYANQHPEAMGRAHAIVGIVLGSIEVLTFLAQVSFVVVSLTAK